MKKFTTYSNWTTCFCDNSYFQHLNHLTAFDEWQNWPSCEGLTQLLPYSVQNENNKSIEFVPQTPTNELSAMAYEEVIYNTGQVPTREHSWHDVFGALIWCLFPKTKSLFNQLHVNDIQKQGIQQRSKLRNALTLFDECGVVIITKNSKMLDHLKQHQWQQAFVEHRALWEQATEEGVLVFTFGHANYERLTKPYIGLTGKWLAIDASAELGTLPLNVQYRYLDEMLSQRVSEGIQNSDLRPLPLLGIPGWHPEQSLSFYQNKDYFRPKTSI